MARLARPRRTPGEPGEPPARTLRAAATPDRIDPKDSMLNWLRKPAAPAPDLAAAVQRGFAAFNAGELDAARTALESVVAADPRHADGNYLLGLVAMRTGDVATALARIDAAIAADATNAAFHFSRGECLRAQGRLEEAVASFRRALERDGDDAGWWNELGLTEDALGRRAAAIEAWRGALGRDAGFVPALCNLGNALAESGDREGARAAFREAMQRAPAFPAGALGLGTLLQADDDLDGAEACYRQVLAAAPEQSEALLNLGALLLKRQDLAEAEAVLRRAVHSSPDFAEAWINLGSVLRSAGRMPEALEAHGRAAELAPRLPAALLQHAITLEVSGDLPAAESRLHEAASLAPEDAEVHSVLASVLMAQGALDEAELEFRRAVDLRPGFAAAWVNYADLLHKTGRSAAAAGALGHALEAEPDLPEAHMNLGVVRMHLNLTAESEASFKRALELRPDMVGAHVGLAALYFLRQRLTECEAACREALALAPDSGASYMNLGNTLQQQGRHDEAIAATRRAIELMADNGQAWSNLMLGLNYRAETTAQELIDEHRRLGAAFPPRRGRRDFDRDRDPGRRLRVGYLSPDFRNHVVSFFIEPVLENHDPRAIEVVGYYNNTQVDEVTRRIQSRAALWRDIAAMDDDRVEQLMLDDRLDILVDLAGHTAKTRLPAVSRRVAPVQATWLGYPNTTGLEAFDWRITDARADPSPSAEAQHVERLWRMPEVFLTYRPPAEAPEVSPPPMIERGHVTFGAYNNYAKVSDFVLALWARILLAVPGSRLVMKTSALKDEGVRDYTMRRLAALGVDTARVSLSAVIPSNREHLATFAGLDLQLDTYPYHGTTTTCESLWMGVPVVSLAGDRHASRVGTSLLESVGAGELVAHDADAYVNLAVALARDPARLSALRARLRPGMQRSALTDPQRFTRQLEEACRGMWRDWLSATA